MDEPLPPEEKAERYRIFAQSLKDHPPDRDLVHIADGLAGHRERVVAHFAVRTQVLGADQVARIDVGLFLTTSDEVETWMTTPAKEALKRQQVPTGWRAEVRHPVEETPVAAT